MTTAQFDHKPLPGPVAADERRAAGVHCLIIELFYLSNVDSVASCRRSRPTAKPMGIAAEFRWYGSRYWRRSSASNSATATSAATTKSSKIVSLLIGIIASPIGMNAISQGCDRKTGIGLGALG